MKVRVTELPEMPPFEIPDTEVDPEANYLAFDQEGRPWGVLKGYAVEIVTEDSGA
jgi:hypothetical protein